MNISNPGLQNAEKIPYVKNVHAFLQREYEIKCIRRLVNIGDF